jgi:murein DD-endopeptidase MepM/ murein hydrolase activator NlpD
MTIRQAACLAACAAAVLAASARADDAVPQPCVAAGVLATRAPGSPVLTVVGPSVTAADRQSATADSFLDPATQLTIDHVDVGAAGCAVGAAPGGTATRTTVWRIFRNSLGGTTLEADLVPATGDGSGWRLRSKVDGLEVDGTPVMLEPGQRVAVGTWGVLRSQMSFDAGAGQALRFWRAALALELTRGYNGFPAGTTFLIGWVSADRRPAPPPTKPAAQPKPKPKPSRTPPVATTTTTTVATATTPAVTTTAAPRPAKPHKHPKPKHVRRGFHPSHQPLRATPPLGRGETYVFPLSAQPSWGDTYGAGRSDVPGGWHHGDDLFAKLGTPVVAVTDGTVFAIGWNRVGGWRLWLRDSVGNAFYYAHLAGYTALARNNTHVRQGQVLGFVGNTGDAHTTDPHLHFEVHPNGLLYLGYDGAVDPTTYLAGWPRANKVKILPPVVLPSDAPVGQGSLTDFRRLLALHPLAHPEQLPKLVSRSGPRVALGGQTARSTAVPAGSQSRAPLVAALSLLLLAGAAVGLTAWNGRGR